VEQVGEVIQWQSPNSRVGTSEAALLSKGYKYKRITGLKVFILSVFSFCCPKYIIAVCKYI
jgi:hypothetical protein